MSTVERLTSFEHSICEVFFHLYGEIGFPVPDGIGVSRRYNSGAGRYVHLVSDARLTCTNLYLDMRGTLINMEGVEDGMGAVIAVTDFRLDHMEIFIYSDFWDGEERPWTMDLPE